MHNRANTPAKSNSQAAFTPRVNRSSARSFTQIQPQSESENPDSQTELSQPLKYHFADIPISAASTIAPNIAKIPILQKQSQDEFKESQEQDKTDEAISQPQVQPTSLQLFSQKSVPTWGKQTPTASQNANPWARQSPNGSIQHQPIHQVMGGEQMQRQPKKQNGKEAPPPDPKVQQAKKDYKQFIASSYKYPSYTTGINGKFDVNYQPAANLLDLAIKVKFTFPDIKGGFFAKLIREFNYINNYVSQIQKAWSKRYTFKNVREPQSVWSKLTPTTVQVRVVPVSANEHFLIKAYLNTAGTSQVSGSNLGKSNLTELYKGSDTPQTPFIDAATQKGELDRIKRINPSPILFDNNSIKVKATDQSKLAFLATYLKRVNSPKFDINIVGHTNTTGQPAYNQKLSEKRARAVETILKDAGLLNHTLKTQGVGQTGASGDSQWRKADITAALPAGWQNTFQTDVHEFGHMIGLDDEYFQSAGKAPQATHYPLVVKAFGKEYADQASQRGDAPNASVMHFGNDIRIHHYVTLWAALCDTTSQKAAVPTPRFGYDDWKFIG